MSAVAFTAQVAANRRLGAGYFVLELETAGENAVAAATPGQFVMLRGAWGRDLLNPRAFSVLEVQGPGRFSILGRAHGRGTTALHDAEVGAPISVTGPLGRGFPAARAGVRQLLVAGGVGLPPLQFQARVAAREGVADAVEMLYGGRSSEDLVLVDELRAWSVPHALATEDGSVGHRGRVTALLGPRIADARASGAAIEILACGPTPMLAAVRHLGIESGVDTFLCLEENMACGFGVCLGCAVPVHGPKPYRYCCTDGPVFEAREVRWP